MSAYMAMSFPKDRRILPHNRLWSLSNIALECRAHRKLVANFIVNASYCDLCRHERFTMPLVTAFSKLTHISI